MAFSVVVDVLICLCKIVIAVTNIVDGRHSAHDIETFYFPSYLVRHNVGVTGLIKPKDERCGDEAPPLA